MRTKPAQRTSAHEDACKEYLAKYTFTDFEHMSMHTGVTSPTLRAICLELVTQGELSIHPNPPAFRKTKEFNYDGGINNALKRRLVRSYIERSVWVSYSDLANRTCIDTLTARRIIADLVALGELKIDDYGTPHPTQLWKGICDE